MTSLLLVTAVVILACILCNKISNRFGIPALLAFIVLGMLFGTDGIIKIPFNDFGLAEQVCSVALIFIMFYGGFGTKWSAAKPAAAKAVTLSTAGVILTAGITGLFCMFVLKMSVKESLLIGAVISSTDAASVFSVLRSKQLSLKYNTAPLLEIESGSNDPCSYMLTAIILSFMSGETSGSGIVYMIFAQLGFGIGCGIVTALCAYFILNKIKFNVEGFDTIFIFAMVVLSYALPSAIGGNGYLSTYIFGIILGNKKLRNKKALVHFFDGVTGLMQMLLFFLLGLLAFPSEMSKIALPALLIALFLTFVARPVSVFVLMTPFKCKIKQQILISAAGLRGAASIVFAIMTVTSPAYISMDIFHIVFFIVLFSILIQGTLLPYAAKKLDMIDESGNVLKTFNDYTDEVPIRFIQFTITPDHEWAGKEVYEIVLPPQTLFVQLRRGESRITPDGSTKIEAGDTLILSAEASQSSDGVNFCEVVLDSENPWVGKTMADIDLEQGKLVIMIQRNDGIVIPNGGTILETGDKLVINEYES